jgi:hypothetical protein
MAAFVISRSMMKEKAIDDRHQGRPREPEKKRSQWPAEVEHKTCVVQVELLLG